jgi:hypothetical protein
MAERATAVSSRSVLLPTEGTQDGKPGSGSFVIWLKCMVARLRIAAFPLLSTNPKQLPILYETPFLVAMAAQVAKDWL